MIVAVPFAVTQSAAQATPLVDPAKAPPAEPSTPAPAAPEQATPAVTASPADPVAASATVEAAPAARHHHFPGDPLEGFNRRMYDIHQVFDGHLLRPVALGYRHVIPKPVRHGFRNFFRNLGEPLVFLNDLLQLKPRRASKTFARFLVNSTIGIGGVLDVAKTKEFNLPHHDNGIGDTLAFYGVRPGPYLFLPLLGPTTLRDFVGGQGEGFVLPAVVGSPFDRWQYQMPKAVTTGLEARAEADDDLRALLDSAVDPYATLRSVYLQNRTAEVDALHGKSSSNAMTNSFDDPLSDPAAGKSSPLDAPLTDPAAPPSAAPPAAPAATDAAPATP